MECLSGRRAPASPQRVSSLADGAQDDKAEEKSIQEAPVGLHHADQEGREEEEEGEEKHREEAGVDGGGPGVGQTPVSGQVVDGSVGDDREEEVGEEGEEEEGEGDPQGAVEDTEELGFIGFGGVRVRT